MEILNILGDYSIDIIIIAILLLFIIIGAWRGLMKTLFHSCSSLIAIGGAIFLHPVIGDFIRKSFIYTAISNAVGKSLGISNAAPSSQPDRINIINSLPLPDSFKGMLLDNNNSVVYDLLNADSVTAYISGFIANIIINIAISVIVFIIIFIIIKIIINALQLAVKIPVLKQINALGGGLLGLAWGVIMIWCIMTVMVIFITTPAFNTIINNIDKSILGKILYDNNIIMNILLKNLFSGL